MAAPKSRIGDPLSLPYAHLNLRRNPFGAPTIHERSELAVVDFDLQLMAQRLQTPGFALLLLGKQGRGKSTHLLAVRRFFPDAPYVHIPESGPVPAILRAPVVFIDEMQRVPRIARWRILRRKASFVIGSHKDHQHECKNAGLSCEVMELSGLTAGPLSKIIEKRIEWARRSGDNPVPRVPKALLTKLIVEYGDDLRAIESYLYDLFQDAKELSDICG